MVEIVVELSRNSEMMHRRIQFLLYQALYINSLIMMGSTQLCTTVKL